MRDYKNLLLQLREHYNKYPENWKANDVQILTRIEDAHKVDGKSFTPSELVDLDRLRIVKGLN